MQGGKPKYTLRCTLRLRARPQSAGPMPSGSSRLCFVLPARIARAWLCSQHSRPLPQDLGPSDVEAGAVYLQALLYLADADAAHDQTVGSVATHLQRLATLPRLRQLCLGPGAASAGPDAAVGQDRGSCRSAAGPDLREAFAYVNWPKTVEVLEQIETDPPIGRLSFIHPWLPGGEGPDPLYPVHKWLCKLQQNVALIRGDCLHRLLAATVCAPHGGRRYPPLYQASHLAVQHKALMAHIVRMLRGESSQHQYWYASTGELMYPPPPPPASTEHFPFGPCFLRTELIRHRTSEPRFQAKGLGK